MSEQPAENEACLDAYESTPTVLLDEAGALAANFTAVHATHLDDGDVSLLGRAGSCCCVCPTTERDLADGIGLMRRLRDAGASLSLGSDSHAVIDLFEEARAVELDERLASGERGRHGAEELMRAASADGHACLGWPDAGRIEPGARADLVTVCARRGAAGRVGSASTRSTLWCSRPAPRTCGTCWWTAGRSSRDGRHTSIDVAVELHEADPEGRRVSSLVIDNIGLLVTGEPALGEGPLGLVRDAALVIDGGRVASIERAGAAGDERIDAAGRCVIPGFVDSHTHLVFAGDRADEFAARMAGRPYAASGIRVTTAGHARSERGGTAGRSPVPDATRRCGRGSPTSRSSPATGSSRRPSAALAPSLPS